MSIMFLPQKDVFGGDKMKSGEEKEEVVEEEEEILQGSEIRFIIKGDEDGLGFELSVKSSDDLKRVEKTFLRVFERVTGYINKKKVRGVDVV